MSTFIHLRGYGEYTPGSLTDVGAAIARAKELGQDALAITDARTLAGVPDFVRQAKAAGIKPIIGLEVSLATSGDRLKVHRIEPDAPLFHNVTLLAANSEGWSNLVAINNASIESTCSRPVVDVPLLSRHAAGLILLTGGLDGPLAEPINRGQYLQAEHNFTQLSEAFGPGNVCVEVTKQGQTAEGLVAAELRRIGARFGAPVVATNPFSYVGEDLAPHHAALKQANAPRTDYPRHHPRPTLRKKDLPALHLRSESEMLEANPDNLVWQESVAMTAEIAGRIENDILPQPSDTLIPRHRLPNGQRDADIYLKDLVVAGLDKRDGCTTPLGMWRADAELKQIRAAGAAKYFLLLHGLVNHLRGKGIAVGPGRGTAGSSYVLYGLGVTDLDPIGAGLYFESFMDPGKRNLPAFQLDVEPRGIEVALKYLTGRYGKDKVARLTAYARYKEEAATRKAELVLGRNAGDGPVDPDDVNGLAACLAGSIKFPTSHATAVAISTEPVADSMPLRMPRTTISQAIPHLEWDRQTVEDTGVLVIHLLHMGSLTPVGTALKEAAGAKRAGGQIGPIPHPSRRDLESVRKAWRLLYEQDLPKLQLGKRTLKEMLDAGRTVNLSELANLYAVARLGSGACSSYLGSRADSISGTATALAILSRVTSSSRGALLYQEQIVELAVEAAGYTVTEGLTLWKALAKRAPRVTEIERERFIAAVEGHLPPSAARPGGAEALFAVIAASAPGALSRAHCFGMALLAFNRAWLMHSYPQEFGTDGSEEFVTS